MPNKLILSFVLLAMLVTAAADVVAGGRVGGSSSVSGLDLGSSR